MGAGGNRRGPAGPRGSPRGGAAPGRARTREAGERGPLPPSWPRPPFHPHPPPPPPASRPPSPAAAARYASPRLRPGPLGRAGPGGGARRPPPERRGRARRGGRGERRGREGTRGRSAVAEGGREGGAGFKGAARGYRSRRRRRAATLPGSHHTDNYQRRPPPSRDEGAGAGPARLHPRDALAAGAVGRGQGALSWRHARSDAPRRAAVRRGHVGAAPLLGHVVGARSGFGGRHVVRPRAGPGMAGAGSNWLSGVNVVLVMAYGSLVRRGWGRPGEPVGTGPACPWGRCEAHPGGVCGVSVGLP